MYDVTGIHVTIHHVYIYNNVRGVKLYNLVCAFETTNHHTLHNAHNHSSNATVATSRGPMVMKL